jgi:hypothetical protein
MPPTQFDRKALIPTTSCLLSSFVRTLTENKA